MATERQALELFHDALAIAKFERLADASGRPGINSTLALVSATEHGSYFATRYFAMVHGAPLHPLLGAEWCWPDDSGARAWDVEDLHQHPPL